MSDFKFSVLLASALTIASVFTTNGVLADTSDLTYVKVNVPFDGYWALKPSGLLSDAQLPSVHPRLIQCEPQISGNYETVQSCYNNWRSDWAVDYYAAEGTTVKFNASSTGGSLTAKVWAIQPTCGSVGAGAKSTAGATVYVNLFVGGKWEGWVSYSHLNEVNLVPGQSVFPGSVLGKLKFWPTFVSKCWEVTTLGGVHTHFEMWNRNKYACWSNRSLNTLYKYSFNASLGYVGRMIYTTIRQKCS